MTLRPIAASEGEALAAALQTADLPTADLGDGARFYALDVDGEVAGFGGLEGVGPDQLIRSVVVRAERRGGGLGAGLVRELAEQARREHVARLWLLTLTAEGFFAGLGWRSAARGEAPPAIARSREFASLCPETAVSMCRTLA
jgi:amino-acid N-acetyltransferase